MKYINKNNETNRNRKSLGYYDGRGLRNERANCFILYSKRKHKQMRTQLDDLRKELKQIDAILYYDTYKKSLTKEKKIELENRASDIRSIIINIQ